VSTEGEAVKPKKPIEVHGDIAIVPLSLGYSAVIDASDVQLVAGSNWYAKRGRNTIYAIRAVYVGDQKSTSEHLHRIILGAQQGVQVDHIDGDGLNNRRANLRAVSASENAMNQRLRKNNTSGHRGVSYCAARNKWIAQIQAFNNYYHLGKFETKEEAIIAYMRASAELHEEFGEASRVKRLQVG
jgi:hypothetical protein